jgi:hypothetical protein
VQGQQGLLCCAGEVEDAQTMACMGAASNVQRKARHAVPAAAWCRAAAAAGAGTVLRCLSQYPPHPPSLTDPHTLLDTLPVQAQWLEEQLQQLQHRCVLSFACLPSSLPLTHSSSPAAPLQSHRLEEQLRQLEQEKEDMAAAAGDSSRPLVKQIEAMAAGAAAQQAAAVETERKLLLRWGSAECG